MKKYVLSTLRRLLKCIFYLIVSTLCSPSFSGRITKRKCNSLGSYTACSTCLRFRKRPILNCYSDYQFNEAHLQPILYPVMFILSLLKNIILSPGAATLLTFIVLGVEVSRSLPTVPYVRSNDLWFFGCTAFIFCSLAEFAFVNSLWRYG